jgi:hypothetical protein
MHLFIVSTTLDRDRSRSRLDRRRLESTGITEHGRRVVSVGVSRQPADRRGQILVGSGRSDPPCSSTILCTRVSRQWQQ